MAAQQEPQPVPGAENNNANLPVANQNAPNHSAEADFKAAADTDAFSESDTNEITTNDGAVVETLDTVFHDKPGWVEGENISGSNRADYYERRSYGKTDVEEELDARKEPPSE